MFFNLKLKWNSIHIKLLATYLALTAIGTSVLASYILFSFYAYFMQTRQTELHDWTGALSESVADALENNDLERVQLIVTRYGAPQAFTLRVFAANGRLLATSNSRAIDLQVKDWSEIAGMKEAFNNQPSQGIAKGVFSNDDRLYVARPVNRNGKMLGVLRMSITLAQFQAKFQTVIWTILFSLILTFLLCAVISEWFTRSMVRPIQAMSDFALRLGSGHLGEKLMFTHSDELGQLATELNRMSERLAALDNERRAFLANVSHELRTPVSNVYVTLEALASGAEQEPELRQRFIQTAQEETKRLSQLIHDLLDLGRLEAGITQLEKQPFNLRDLIERAVRAMESRMRAAKVQIDLNVPDVKLEGDPERLLQAFLNILDNAIKHSVADSMVFIQGHVEGSTVALEIQDQGKGISQTDLPHIFEQFYTAERSRQGRGTGLGLAIARRIVEAHAGSITVKSTLGKGAVFTLYLPLTP